ncbi:YbaK/EbsC family protein, partial [Acinetobacter baumannii]
MLQQAGVAFTVHSYDYDPDAEQIGMQAAAALGEAPARVLKTLMALADGRPVVVIVPSGHEVSMKKLAAAFGAKSAQMMKPADAERLS